MRISLDYYSIIESLEGEIRYNQEVIAPRRSHKRGVARYAGESIALGPVFQVSECHTWTAKCSLRRVTQSSMFKRGLRHHPRRCGSTNLYRGSSIESRKSRDWERPGFGGRQERPRRLSSRQVDSPAPRRRVRHIFLDRNGFELLLGAIVIGDGMQTVNGRDDRNSVKLRAASHRLIVNNQIRDLGRAFISPIIEDTD
jgi:hypothetical protein